MEPTAPSLILEYVEGPSIGAIALSRDESATVGRARECQVCLPDATVSRRHATVASRGSRWFVRDLGSRHGTYLNAVRLTPHVAHPLVENDLLRIGPWTFRAVTTAAHATMPTSVTAVHRETRVERISSHELAQHRLNLILDGATRINAATDETELALAVIDSVLAATAYDRAALLRPHDKAERVEILAHRAKGSRGGIDGRSIEKEGFAFSRSLLQAAATGQMTRLASDQSPSDLGASIERLGITDALCAPIMLGGTVAAYLYLDASEQELPIHADAADFCLAIARMCGLALANLKRIDLERRQRSLERDIAAAREAQQLIVPASEGVLGHLRYALRMKPGSFVAGDLFDLFAVDDRRVGVFIGDVTGEGIGAAILMAFAQSHLHAALKRTGDPAAALNEVNSVLCARTASNRFISMWVGVIDSQSDELTYVDAGHGYWVIRRMEEEGSTIHLAPLPGGTLVGIDASLRYENVTTQLTARDRLVLFSDGLVEQRNMTGEQFGVQRIMAALTNDGTPSEDVTRLFDAVHNFALGDDLADDATAASIQCVGD